ncbi:LLM class flavin-dependent oxidoreductase [Sphingomonas faeni]|uniref:LLM class flavin-dependent oxidoreductase n=1 Tax=Sphingomonas faeni TaxID=185950 RepID=UPI0020C81B08|nr:LLM class flavin-dependent oxidoreductase [Sphingomonas faeni]MCP8890741.1 LLM class flavin-dependent oxidoreductase [Sphingomonas faeni]
MTRAPLILSAGIGDARLSDPVWAKEMVALADQARIDLLLLGDGHASPFDPLVVASWLAPHAGSVGLVPTIDTGRDLPFHVARALSALDFLTGGCSGWQPSTLVQPSIGDSVPRGVDFVGATRSLWDSWDADALVIDPTTGVYLDSGKVRRNDYRGDYFRVLGPLNAARPPQGHPVLVQTDADPLWSQVAADVVIIDMDSPKPPPGPKCLLRTYTALAGLDQITQLYRDGIIDGIHLTPPYPRKGLQEFADTMLPALIERGLLPATRPEIQRAGTLRERLGLSVAPHSFHPIQAD